MPKPKPKATPRRRAGRKPNVLRIEGDPLKALDRFLAERPKPKAPKRPADGKANPKG